MKLINHPILELPIVGIFSDHRIKDGWNPNVHIYEEKATPNFMIEVPLKLNGQTGTVFSAKHKNQVGTHIEALYFLKEDGLYMDAIYGVGKYEAAERRYPIDIVRYLGDKIDKVYRLTIVNWFEKTEQWLENDGVPLGQFIESDFYVTEIKAPEEGWYRLAYSVDLTENVKLHNDILLPGICAKYDKNPNLPLPVEDYEEVANRLQLYAAIFEGEVYQPDLKNILSKLDLRGTSTVFPSEEGDITMLTYEMAGRVMFTFKRGEDKQFTVLGASGEVEDSRMGSNSINATLPEVTSIISTVCDIWKSWNEEERIINIKADIEVNLGF